MEEAGYKHSHIDFQGLTVENHYCFDNHNKTLRGQRTEEILLNFMSECEPTPIANTRLLSPPPAFTALFMLRHALTHFMLEGIRLRHVIDWHLFLQRHGEVLLRDDVRQALREMRLEGFAKVLTAFCERHLGLQQTVMDTSVDDTLLADFTEDLFAGQPPLSNRSTLAVAKRILRRLGRMWRFRMLLDDTYLMRVWATFAWAHRLKRKG